MPHTHFRFSPFMKYLASMPADTACRLPPLTQLSKQLNISVASLREQMEVARIMGLIEVHPRTGIQKVKFSFTHTVVMRLMYGNEAGEESFQQISDLRKHVEAAYWQEAASQLTSITFGTTQSYCTQGHSRNYTLVHRRYR